MWDSTKLNRQIQTMQWFDPLVHFAVCPSPLLAQTQFGEHVPAVPRCRALCKWEALWVLANQRTNNKLKKYEQIGTLTTKVKLEESQLRKSTKCGPCFTLKQTYTIVWYSMFQKTRIVGPAMSFAKVTCQVIISPILRQQPHSKPKHGPCHAKREEFILKPLSKVSI